jgi:hypothetical protein
MRFVLAVALTILSPPAIAESGQRDRHEFSRTLSTIHVGMPEAAAREILGDPDDIRTHEDPGVVIGFYDIREVWCYGTAGHLAFPTLGQVGIDEDGTVRFVRGGTGAPLPPGLIEEPELRRVLTQIDRVPAIECDFNRPYNPLDVIRVVNALQPLGRKKAFVVLDEYMRVKGASTPPENLVLICLALFTPDPKATLPRLHLPWMQHRATFSHYPIIVREDVPLFLFPLGGYGRSGPPMPTAPTIDHFRNNGSIRAAPLTPPDDPLQVLTRFEASAAWVFAEAENDELGRYSEANQARILVMNQLLWLVDSVCAVEPDWTGTKFRLGCDEDDPGDQWATVIEPCDPLDIVWSKRLQQYTFLDGSWLPPPDPPRRRHMWRIDAPEMYVRIFIQRVTPKLVHVTLRYNGRPSQPVPPAQVRVVRAEDGRVVAEWAYPATRSGSGSMSEQIELATGEALLVELVRDDTVVKASPTYEP